MDLVAAGSLLALYEFAGVAGALTGGTLSDRIGRKRTVLTATAVSAVLMYMFLNIQGPILLVVLVLLGFISLSVTPVLQALVQEQLPTNRATASGMFMLYAFIVRAINTLIIGLIGNAAGLGAAYAFSIFVSLLALPLILLLPDSPPAD